MKFKIGDRVVYKTTDNRIFRGKISSMNNQAISVKVVTGGFRFLYFKYGDEKRLRVVK